MFHLAGYYQSVDQAAAAGDINAMNDTVMFSSGKQLRVSKNVPMLAGAALLTAATTLTSAFVKSPSLRVRNNFPVAPVVNADDFPSLPPIASKFRNPIPLAAGEPLTFETTTDHASAVAIQGLVWLSDGVAAPVRNEIFTAKLTTAITLAAGVWTNGTVTFVQGLPTGLYQVVGFRAEGTNLQAARLVFPDSSPRPGVPALSAHTEDGLDIFRDGELGVWGTFDSEAPFSVDALGHTDSTQTYYVDLVKIG